MFETNCSKQMGQRKKTMFVFAPRDKCVQLRSKFAWFCRYCSRHVLTLWLTWGVNTINVDFFDFIIILFLTPWSVRTDRSVCQKKDSVWQWSQCVSDPLKKSLQWMSICDVEVPGWWHDDYHKSCVIRTTASGYNRTECVNSETTTTNTFFSL